MWMMLSSATIGTYAVLKDPNYVRSIHFLTEYQGDNMHRARPLQMHYLTPTATRTLVDMSHVNNVWQQSYFVINSANKGDFFCVGRCFCCASPA